LTNIEKKINKIIIRDMVKEDLAQIVKMEKAIFSDAWPKSAFKQQLDESNWYAEVALCDNNIIGYSCFHVVDIETHLTNIAVLPEFRRKSVAKRLLESILLRATESGCGYIILEVRVSNAEARSFYNKNGFTLLYERPGYYSNPKEDAMVMVRYLNKD